MLDGIFRENRMSFAVLAVMWVVAIAAVMVLPESSKNGIRYNNDSFWEWARKRQIEIGMMEPEQAEVAQAELNDKIESVRDLEEEMRRLDPDGARP